mmetsp:Transcript_113797/g.332409  ORF Transcript_113797/g.332409 Transcript_113797/m.332409 type:complete len:484 (+) Transcript_113797:73-1524(+)
MLHHQPTDLSDADSRDMASNAAPGPLLFTGGNDNDKIDTRALMMEVSLGKDHDQEEGVPLQPRRGNDSAYEEEVPLKQRRHSCLRESGCLLLGVLLTLSAVYLGGYLQQPGASTLADALPQLSPRQSPQSPFPEGGGVSAASPCSQAWSAARASGGGGGSSGRGLPAPERPAPSHFALPLVLDRARQQRYAYVLMAYDVPGRPLSYIWRAVTMSRALQRLSDYPVLLLTNTTHFPDGSPVVESFAKLGVQVLPVHQVPVPPHVEKSLTPQWRIAYWKLQIWRFTHYDKLVWLDIDGVITRSLDHVFELEPPWAQRDVWVCSATQGFQDWPCSGLMLIEPSEDTYQGLLQFARSTTIKWWVDGDQRLLQHYFQDVARTPMKLLDLADAAFGKCLGVIPNLFNETPGEIWNMPAYVHKSSVKNECFYFIIAKQLRQVEGRTVNICHYHHLGSYWRELFCQGLAEIRVKTPVTEAYCDDFLWHRHR